MTLHVKPRRFHHAGSHFQPTQKRLHQNVLPIRRHNNNIQKSSMNQSDILDMDNMPISLVTKQETTKVNTRESFLQRFLNIERRHDEKNTNDKNHESPLRHASDKINLGNDEIIGSQYNQHTGQSKSPTRWLSEQIFDDSLHTDSLNGEQWPDLDENKQLFYRSSFPNRLPSLPDTQQTSSVSSLVDTTSLSAFKAYKDVDFPVGSMQSISYVELQQNNDSPGTLSTKRKRPLRLPPIFLPPIYTVRPRPLKERDFLTPTRIRGPITDDEWDDLRQCRYIRQGPPRFHVPTASSELSLL